MSKESIHIDSTTQKNHIKAAGSQRMISTLGIAGFISGIILVSAYISTLPIIEANKKEALQKAIFQVIPSCNHYKALYLIDGRLQLSETDSENEHTEEEEPVGIYAAFDHSDQLLGFAVNAQENGYQDVISGIFGFDPFRNQIIGFEVLSSKETPGLGDKIMKDKRFIDNFKALNIDPEIILVKRNEKTKANEVEAITGATISSKAVSNMMQKAITKWRVKLETFTEENQING